MGLLKTVGVLSPLIALVLTGLMKGAKSRWIDPITSDIESIRDDIDELEDTATDAQKNATSNSQRLNRLEQYLLGYDDQEGAIPKIERRLNEIQRTQEDLKDMSRTNTHNLQRLADDSDEIDVELDDVDSD